MSPPSARREKHRKVPESSVHPIVEAADQLTHVRQLRKPSQALAPNCSPVNPFAWTQAFDSLEGRLGTLGPFRDPLFRAPLIISLDVIMQPDFVKRVYQISMTRWGRWGPKKGPPKSSCGERASVRAALLGLSPGVDSCASGEIANSFDSKSWVLWIRSLKVGRPRRARRSQRWEWPASS